MSMLDSNIYKIFVFAVIMPLNGFLMTNNFYLGLGLALVQLPWYLDKVLKIKLIK